MAPSLFEILCNSELVLNSSEGLFDGYEESVQVVSIVSRTCFEI